ncbi:hypothetical protein DPX16_16882 [Anabarilius grahami]|uniref:Uncharacterized protein n=1 Tax=Anabarilius grahami TaxID=495550 RepID=A0A3N0YMA1_ANAGA|nr:hypothetical protein DPX16_16882 [Anabarilius grahami]
MGRKKCMEKWRDQDRQRRDSMETVGAALKSQTVWACVHGESAGMGEKPRGRKLPEERTRRPELESKNTAINAHSALQKSSAALHRIGAYGFINNAQFYAKAVRARDSSSLFSSAHTARLQALGCFWKDLVQRMYLLDFLEI